MELVRAIVDAASRATGTGVEVVGPTRRGESGTMFDVRVGGEAAVLKVLANGPHVLDNQHRLLRLHARDATTSRTVWWNSASPGSQGAGGGHPWILSDLEAFLETGSTQASTGTSGAG